MNFALVGGHQVDEENGHPSVWVVPSNKGAPCFVDICSLEQFSDAHFMIIRAWLPVNATKSREGTTTKPIHLFRCHCAKVVDAHKSFVFD